MEPKGKPGSFSAYLKSGPRSGQSDTGTRQAMTALDLLRLLSGEPQMALVRLGDLAGMDAGTLQRNLKELVGSGFVTIQGDQLDQTVTLTEAGARVVSLTK